MTSLVTFSTALIIVCMMVQSTLQMSNTYVQRQESTYHFYYNVNEPGVRKSQEETRIDNSANSGGYFLANPGESRQIVDHKTHPQRRYYDFGPKDAETIFATAQKTPLPESSYHEASQPGYLRLGRPVGPQFNPAPGLSLTPHKLIPGYEKEKLPPGYVALVAKIDTPKGYKLLDEHY